MNKPVASLPISYDQLRDWTHELYRLDPNWTFQIRAWAGPEHWLARAFAASLNGVPLDRIDTFCFPYIPDPVRVTVDRSLAHGTVLVERCRAKLDEPWAGKVLEIPPVAEAPVEAGRLPVSEDFDEEFLRELRELMEEDDE